MHTGLCPTVQPMRRADRPGGAQPSQPSGPVEDASGVAPAFDRTTSGDLVTITEAARLAGVHRNTVRTWCATGRLSSVRINHRGDRRIRRRDLQGLVARRSAEQAVAIAEAGTAQTNGSSRLPTSSALRGEPEAQPANVPEARRREDAIRRIAGEVSRRTELETILADVLEATVSLFSADRAALWLCDPDVPQPFQLAAHHNLSPALREAITRVSLADDLAIVRSVRNLRVEVVVDPAEHVASPGLRDAYLAAGVGTACFVPIVFGESAARRPVDPARGHPTLAGRRDRAGPGFRRPGRLGDRQRPAAQPDPRYGGPAAGDPGSRRPPERPERRDRDRRGDRGRDPQPHRLRQHPGLPGRPRPWGLRADRFPGHVHGHPGRAARDAPLPDRRGPDRLGCGQQPVAPRPRGGARSPADRDRPGRRARIDAPRPGHLRRPSRGRDRARPVWPQPVRAGPGGDPLDLCRPRGPGPGQRRQPGPRPAPAGRARAAPGRPAPPARGQRRAPLDPRPGGRPRDDRRPAQGGRGLRRPDDLPGRSGDEPALGGHRPGPLRRGDPARGDAPRGRPDRLGDRPS